jgi:hypothetical protein
MPLSRGCRSSLQPEQTPQAITPRQSPMPILKKRARPYVSPAGRHVAAAGSRDGTGWPKNPRALAGRLRRAQTFLRARASTLRSVANAEPEAGSSGCVQLSKIPSAPSAASGTMDPGQHTLHRRRLPARRQRPGMTESRSAPRTKGHSAATGASMQLAKIPRDPGSGQPAPPPPGDVCDENCRPDLVAVPRGRSPSHSR